MEKKMETTIGLIIVGCLGAGCQNYKDLNVPMCGH